MPNFTKILRTWVLMVSGESERRAAIWRLVRPKQLNAVTSCSRGESDSHLSQSSSTDLYGSRLAARWSGINSCSGRSSCRAVVERETCKPSLSYLRGPGFGRKPIRNKKRCQIDIRVLY